jgi:hypothetical protein
VQADVILGNQVLEQDYQHGSQAHAVSSDELLQRARENFNPVTVFDAPSIPQITLAAATAAAPAPVHHTTPAHHHTHHHANGEHPSAPAHAAAPHAAPTPAVPPVTPPVTPNPTPPKEEKALSFEAPMSALDIAEHALSAVAHGAESVTRFAEHVSAIPVLGVVPAALAGAVRLTQAALNTDFEGHTLNRGQRVQATMSGVVNAVTATLGAIGLGSAARVGIGAAIRSGGTAVTTGVAGLRSAAAAAGGYGQVALRGLRITFGPVSGVGGLARWVNPLRAVDSAVVTTARGMLPQMAQAGLNEAGREVSATGNVNARGVMRAVVNSVPDAAEASAFRTVLSLGAGIFGAGARYYGPPVTQMGGAYRTVRTDATEASLGGEVHHMPAGSATDNARATFAENFPDTSLPSRERGPAIWMETVDHQLTPSHSSWGLAGIWQRQQRRLIEAGNYLDAMQMDVNWVRGAYGTRYEGAIQQMGEHLMSGH